MTIGDLKEGAHIHLIGICGTAMASLAGLLQDMGFQVTGSDIASYPPMSDQLKQLGISIKKGYVKENLTPRPDFVIVGNAITAKYEEAIALLETDIPYTSLPKAIGEVVIADRSSFVISGTHGKTTTTSMMAWAMDALSLDPGFLIGGIPNNYPRSFRFPKSDWFVIEGDEYDTAFFDKVPKFVYYKPRYVTLTSIEFDHADIYSDISEINEVFRGLLKSVRSDGHVLVAAEDPNIAEIAPASEAPVYTYGLRRGDYSVGNLQFSETGSEFDIVFEEKTLVHIQLPMSGEHNVLNALSVVAHAHILQWDIEKVAASFKGYRGVKRRQEVLGTPGGVRVVEDFAHHPTAVKKTLEGLKKQYSTGRLIGVFEPRSATSRRSVFQEDYLRAFASADEVVLSKPFDMSKIDPAERFSAEKLIDDLKASKSAHYIPEVDDIVSHLGKSAESGDTVVIMSNGGFGDIYQKLMTRLSQ